MSALDDFIDANIDTAKTMLIKANVAYTKEEKIDALKVASKLIEKSIQLLEVKGDC